jgi:hypothetical protein
MEVGNEMEPNINILVMLGLTMDLSFTNHRGAGRNRVSEILS